MRKTVFTTILLLAAAISSGPAALAMARPRAPDFATAAMHNFAICVADRGPKEAAEVLAIDYRSREYNQKLNRLARDRNRCLFAGRLKFNGILFAGGLAERLAERGRAPGDLANLLRYDPSLPPVAARDETETMALCTVREAPGAVAALLATAPATAAEEAAMREIGPTVGSCLAAGQKMRLNRPGLRSLLALAAYRVLRSRGVAA
jgi:hypothetical protein